MTRAESCIAAVLLGVVELWLSQGCPKTARTGVWGFSRTDCCPYKAFAENMHRSPSPSSLRHRIRRPSLSVSACWAAVDVRLSRYIDGRLSGRLVNSEANRA